MTVRKTSNAIPVGRAAVPGRVWLAPMTGISDLPFRRVAARLGAAYVATEMVVSDALLAGSQEALRRAAVGEGLPLMVVQLVGADPAAIARAASLAAASGADIVDLNFGCPAKSVTGVACGSALMRDLTRAETLIRAAVQTSACPVTVKMRLGWDEGSRSAPELAARAEAAGAAAITVHARTRQQFYAGAADWGAVRPVKAATRLPVVVNGDIVDLASARRALALSGADAVMIGRGALGRPWIAAALDAGLDGRAFTEPGPAERLEIVLEHLAASVAFHGELLGIRMFRKHLAAYVEAARFVPSPDVRRHARARLCQLEAVGEIARGLEGLWARDRPALAA